MEWRRQFTGGYLTTNGEWKVEYIETSWRLSRLVGPRGVARWVVWGRFLTLGQAKACVRESQRA